MPMRFLKALLPVFVLGIMALAPYQAQAATANFFGPIFPTECHCPQSAPDFGCVLQTIENLMNFAISIGVVIFVLVAAYAGFLWMFSPMNAHNREQGRSVLMNAVIGLLITLCAWLLVDFVMKTLYSGEYGPWNAILKEGNACLATVTPPAGAGFVDDPTTTTGTGTGSGANCPAGDPASMVAFPSSATTGGEQKATQSTVDRFMQMRAAAAEDGVNLRVFSSYRSEAKQVELWNQYCSSGTCSRPVAKPCTMEGPGSNHNSGEAVDIYMGSSCGNGTTNCRAEEYVWLRAHASQYGFANTVANDPVHWSPNGR